MIQMLGAVAPLAKILFSTIEKSVPDKDLQEKLNHNYKLNYYNLIHKNYKLQQKLLKLKQKRAGSHRAGGPC